jgi:hypothetical protein
VPASLVPQVALVIKLIMSENDPVKSSMGMVFTDGLADCRSNGRGVVQYMGGSCVVDVFWVYIVQLATMGTQKAARSRTRTEGDE